jgi:hypothetical protein
MLNSKARRATYISTLLESKQRPFIWEYFRPGTIEIPLGEETYYDEVSPHLSFDVQDFYSTLHVRDAEAHSNRFLSSVPSRHISRRVASRCGFRSKRTLGVQLVRSLSQLLQ